MKNKNKKQQQFSSETQKKQKKLFLESNIFKAVIIISIPSMIISLMTALYTFSDQLLMTNLIPKLRPFENSFSAFGFETFQNYIDQLNNTHIVTLTSYTSALIVRNAVASTAPITVAIGAFGVLVGNGTSIAISKMNGKKNTLGAEKSWAIGFYSNFALGLFATVLICTLVKPLINLENGDILGSLSHSKENIKDAASKCGLPFNEVYRVLEEGYTKANHLILNYAYDFSYILAGGMIASMFAAFLPLLIITEAKQKIVLLAAILSNLLNLLLDFIFIYYCELAMLGGAIATVIGWSFNASWYLIQIWIMNRKNTTNLKYSALAFWNYGWNWRLTYNIFTTGVPSFLRWVSMGIATWFQLYLLANSIIPHIAGDSGSTAAAYSNFYGAVNPIYNLFFPVLQGTIQGSRIMSSYLYGAKKFERFRKTYWIASLIGMVYGVFAFLVVGLLLRNTMLGLFGINEHIANYNIAQMMLLISLAQLPVFSMAIGGQLMFQSTGRSLFASICGIMQGFLVNFPVSFSLVAICKTTHSINLFLWNPFIVIVLAAIITLIWSSIYMRKHFSPDLKTKKLNKNTAAPI